MEKIPYVMVLQNSVDEAEIKFETTPAPLVNNPMGNFLD